MVEDKSSEAGQVTLGVPQGSVLGPTIFRTSLYKSINVLGDGIKAKVHLFADNPILTLSHRIRLESPSDPADIQEDLKKLEQWESRWQMSFNVSKCHVLLVTNRKKCIPPNYTLHGQTLQQVISVRYRGWSWLKADTGKSIHHYQLHQCQSQQTECSLNPLLQRPRPSSVGIHICSLGSPPT